jgi:ketosteroid isomerase-like protein
MRTALACVAVLTVLLLGLAAEASVASENRPDVQAVRSALQRWEAAYNSGDLNRMKGFWTDDIVALYQLNEPISGLKGFWESFAAQVKATFAAYDVDYKLGIDEVDASGDMAFDRGTIHISLKSKAGGETIFFNERYLEIMRKQPDGSWRVARAMANDPPLPPAPAGASVAAAQAFVGDWQTTISTPTGLRRFTLKLTRKEGGGIAGFLEAAENGNRYTIDNVTAAGTEVHIQVPILPAVITGKLDGDTIQGRYYRGPSSLPLTMVRSHQ